MEEFGPGYGVTSVILLAAVGGAVGGSLREPES